MYWSASRDDQISCRAGFVSPIGTTMLISQHSEGRSSLTHTDNLQITGLRMSCPRHCGDAERYRSGYIRAVFFLLKKKTCHIHNSNNVLCILQNRTKVPSRMRREVCKRMRIFPFLDEISMLWYCAT